MASGWLRKATLTNPTNQTTGKCQPHRSYTEITGVPKLISTMEDYLTDFNATSKRPMNLAMFLFAVEHVSRICRWAEGA